MSITGSRTYLTRSRIEGLNAELLCGKLEVPENPDLSDGRAIPLNTVVIPALDPPPDHTPLFQLDGGPGMPATQAAAFYVRDFPLYRQKRDVVLIDQRGTGGSHPLHCRLHGDLDPLRAYFEEMYPPEAVARCRDELEQDSDLTQYTTRRSAQDLEQARLALGYKQIDLFAFSYGTRLALDYMRQYPQNVRSAVLVGLVPTDMNLPSSYPQDTQRVLDLLFERAKAHYPGLKQEFSALLQRLATKPARVHFSHPLTGEQVEVEIHRDRFAEIIRTQLYSPATARSALKMIHQAASGDFNLLVELAKSHSRSPSPLAEGMYLSVTCSEDVPFIDLDAAERNNLETYLGSYRVQQQTRACRLWRSAQLPPGFRDPVQVDTPVLLISGDLDPVTPPRWGEAVAKYLPNSMHVIVPHMAHFPAGVMGLSHLETVDLLVLHFLDHLSTDGFDLALLDQMLPPPFEA